MADDSSRTPADYKPLARQDGLSTRVKTQLLEMILAGTLSPADKLPPERELATKFGVSRNVVRRGASQPWRHDVLERGRARASTSPRLTSPRYSNRSSSSCRWSPRRYGASSMRDW